MKDSDKSGCPLIHTLDTINGSPLEVAETLPGMIRAAIHECSKDNIRLEVYQQDWLPGFAAFQHDGNLKPDSPVHLAINIGSFLSIIENKDIEKKDLPYFIAESLMHEFIHTLEAWAEVEFDEVRIEALLKAYREKYQSKYGQPTGPTKLSLVNEDGTTPPPEEGHFRWCIEPAFDKPDTDGNLTNSDNEAKEIILKTAESHLWDQHEGGVRDMTVMFDPTVPHDASMPNPQDEIKLNPEPS